MLLSKITVPRIHTLVLASALFISSASSHTSHPSANTPASANAHTTQAVSSKTTTLTPPNTTESNNSIAKSALKVGYNIGKLLGSRFFFSQGKERLFEAITDSDLSNIQRTNRILGALYAYMAFSSLIISVTNDCFQTEPDLASYNTPTPTSTIAQIIYDYGQINGIIQSTADLAFLIKILITKNVANKLDVALSCIMFTSVIAALSESVYCSYTSRESVPTSNSNITPSVDASRNATPASTIPASDSDNASKATSTVNAVPTYTTC